jgi:hypothetical protein
VASGISCRAKHLTLNQRVQGSSPCAPTNEIKALAEFGGSVFAGQQSHSNHRLTVSTCEVHTLVTCQGGPLGLPRAAWRQRPRACARPEPMATGVVNLGAPHPVPPKKSQACSFIRYDEIPYLRGPCGFWRAAFRTEGGQ